MSKYFTPRRIAYYAGGVFLFFWLISVYWSFEPDVFDIREVTNNAAQKNNQQAVTGYYVTTTLIEVGNTLLDKPGGYLSNDIMPPGLFMDNMPSWEFGALEVMRDLALAMRRDLSRSQSQSIENPWLVKAQPNLNINSKSWLLPPAESQYEEAIAALEAYRFELGDPNSSESQFYARADNLRDWLKQVEKRMGSLSQILSASVGAQQINIDLAGDASARQSTPTSPNQYNKTSWWKLDDNFYEARGASWALLHFLKAVEVDFADVLKKKNATVSVKQIIRELEATQQTVWSPVIMNGSGFGLAANHSLVMANYISRANAALIELSELLNQG